MEKESKVRDYMTFISVCGLKKKKKIDTHVSLATIVAHLAAHQTTLKLCTVAARH